MARFIITVAVIFLTLTCTAVYLGVKTVKYIAGPSCNCSNTK